MEIPHPQLPRQRNPLVSRSAGQFVGSQAEMLDNLGQRAWRLGRVSPFREDQGKVSFKEPWSPVQVFEICGKL